MKKERVRTKRGFRGFGKFVLGWFVGFISTILLIVGLGYWAYTSLSVRKIEKFTKSDITNNEGLEKLTLKKAVAVVQGISKSGTDAYTLAKLEEDFNIELPKTLGDTGITLDIIKNSSFKNFEQAIEDTIQTITFNNILKFIGTEESDDLGVIDTILEKESIYYIDNGKLYTNPEHTIEVDFDYTIEGSTVKLDTGAQNTISSGQVKFTLSDLPLNSALTSMTDTTQKLKVYELLDYYYDANTDRYYQEHNNGVYSSPVSGVMDAIAGYTIDELSNQETIDNLKIHEVMGYYYNESDKCYYTSDTFSSDTKVASVMNALADKTIGDLSKDETYNKLFVYEVMGYTRIKVEGNPITYIYKNGEKDVEGIISLVAGSTISTLSQDIQALTIGQILGVDINDATGVIKALHGTSIDGLEEKINDLTLGEALGKTYDEATGVLKTFYNTKVIELADEISDIKIWQAMGYFEKDDNGAKSYYLNYNDDTKEYSNPVTGIMATLAEKSVGDLSNSETFNKLYIYDVMGYYYNESNDTYYKSSDDLSDDNKVTGVMGMLKGVQLENIEQKINDIINNTKVYELIQNGVITITLDEQEDASTIAFLSTHTVPSLIQFINNNIDALMLLVPQG